MKLRMGKDEDKPADKLTEEKADSKEEAPPNSTEVDEEKESKPVIESSEEVEETEVKQSADKKTDVDSLRKVIKVESAEKTEEDASEKKVDNDPNNLTETGLDSATEESSDKKHEILQNIRDFDFQIKKNQGDINNLNQKLDNVSKDLDDLVSLYEIVSEQMNPFVGLSKVTKKRIDALENFTKEVENLKTRMGELESFAERSGVKLNGLREETVPILQNIDDDILDKSSDEETADTEKSGQLSDEENQSSINSDQIPENTVDKNISVDISKKETQQPISIENVENEIPLNLLSDRDLDDILERSLKVLYSEEKIDTVIDEFIENLKVSKM